MKKYAITFVFIFIGLGCFILYRLIGSEVAADGILNEPFYLIPLGYLFFFIGIMSLIVVLIKPHLRKKGK